MLLRDRVYQAIRQAILTCEFVPGQELREQTLAERYKVSRSPIRDALLRLELENLVTVLPRQGYLINQIAMSDVEDLMGLRLLIEPACAAGAAGADDTALRALDRFRISEPIEQTEAEFLEYNTAFHRAVIDLAGNARMTAIGLELDEQYQRVLRVSLRTFHFQRVRHAFADHAAIIDALQAHDADRASRLCYEHSARSHARVLAEFRHSPLRPPDLLGALTKK